MKKFLIIGSSANIKMNVHLTNLYPLLTLQFHLLSGLHRFKFNFNTLNTLCKLAFIPGSVTHKELSITVFKNDYRK